MFFTKDVNGKFGDYYAEVSGFKEGDKSYFTLKIYKDSDKNKWFFKTALFSGTYCLEDIHVKDAIKYATWEIEKEQWYEHEVKVWNGNVPHPDFIEKEVAEKEEVPKPKIIVWNEK